jgi:hydroxypyruvate isomerase
MTPWKLRFAPNLGLVSPTTPTFLHSVGSADPVRQIDFVADHGFAGVEDNFLKLRPVDEQRRIGEALERRNLEMGCFVNNIESWNKPLWGSAAVNDRKVLRADLTSSIEVAKRVRGKYLTVITGRDLRIPLQAQLANLIENLKRLADQAYAGGVVLGVEVTNEWGFPGMLVHHIADANAIVRAVDHPAVRLVFDVFHVQAMDGDILRNLDAAWEQIGIIQVADNPGRLELGTGELNWVRILRHLVERGYAGLVELEHGFGSEGIAAEQEMLRTLGQINDQL